MKQLLPVLLLLTYCKLHAQDYAVSRIPSSLLNNAGAVKRSEIIEYELINTHEAILHRKFAITILKEKAASSSSLVEYYDKLREVSNIEGALYDANGKQIKRLKNKQIIDFSGLDDNNLADDDRIKYHQFYSRDLPYTVEYDVEIRLHNTLLLPSWMPIDAEGTSLEKSVFTVTVPADYNLRYHSSHFTKEPAITSGPKNRKVYQWSANNLPALKAEFASPPWYETNPFVLTGPSEFSIEAYTGSMSTWNDFGKFVFALKKGRDNLPASVKTVVHQLTDNIPDPKTKIEILYNYLQKNTRYISVQLGIGGWQPFDAAYVAGNGYGDCKALTNYMFSMLKEAGIGSNYTLIKAGNTTSPLIDFPSQQFNHVILMVPLSIKDTVWLECTSNTLPAGYLSGFTADRLALAVTENGGMLVHTPKYGKEQNVSLRNTTASVAESGDLLIKRKAVYSGLSQDLYHYMINEYSADKLKEKLQETIDLAQPDIRSLHYLEKETAIPTIEEDLEIAVTGFASQSGRRLFMALPLLQKWNTLPAVDSNRKTGVVLKDEFTESDTLFISIPKGYTVESKPSPINISNQFGEFRVTVEVTGSGIHYVRYLLHNSGRYPSSAYNELARFYDVIYRSDRSRIVLVSAQ